LQPLPFPQLALVGVTDTNALAARACNAASRGRREDLFGGLAHTGRCNTYVSAHVPGELDQYLAVVATHYPGLDRADAERVLWGQVMPAVPVVDLAIGDYLHPRVRTLLRADPDLPRRLRGDPDDAGTAALAEFVAPAVIISADSVFTRFGMASTVATTWLPAAYTLLRMAGFEASLADAAVMLELGTRLLVTAAGAAVRAARNYPLPALGIVAAAGFAAWRAGYLSRERLTSAGREVVQAAQPWLAKAEAAFGGYQQARAALTVIEPYGLPTVEQLAARRLARSPRALPLPYLVSALADDEYPVAADEVDDAVRRHPAFGITEGDLPEIWIGRRIIRLSAADQRQ
jgi:hypothetical protein